MNREKFLKTVPAFFSGLYAFLPTVLLLGIVSVLTNGRTPLRHLLVQETGLDLLIKLAATFTLASTWAAWSSASMFGDLGFTWGTLFGLAGALLTFLPALNFGNSPLQTYGLPLLPLALAVSAGLAAERRASAPAASPVKGPAHPKHGPGHLPATTSEAEATVVHPKQRGELERRIAAIESRLKRTQHDVEELSHVKELPAPKEVHDLEDRMRELEVKLKKDEKDIDRLAHQKNGAPKEIKTLEHRIAELEAQLKRDEKTEDKHFHKLQKNLQDLARQVVNKKKKS